MNPSDELKTVADFVRYIATRLAHADVYFGHGTDNAWDEAFALVCGHLRIAPDKIEFVMTARLTRAERRELIRLLERRIVHRVPVPYLVGEAWFARRRYLIGRGVLIPRSPIAELIDAEFAPWLSRLPDRILDLGTGSGCVGIACAHTFPDAQVVLSDIDDAALDLAARNVALHGVADRVSLVRADVFDGLEPAPFDLIVTNPPYVNAQDFANMPAEYRHEPNGALAAGIDGLDVIRRVSGRCAALARRGRVARCRGRFECRRSGCCLPGHPVRLARIAATAAMAFLYSMRPGCLDRDDPRYCARRGETTIMAGNTFGQAFTVTTFGESHGPAIGAVVDGCPPGLPLDESDLQRDLDRRRPGQSKYTTQRQEADEVRILSGVFEGDHHGYTDRLGHRQHRPEKSRLQQYPRRVPAGPRGLYLSEKIRHSRLPRRRTLVCA